MVNAGEGLIKLMYICVIRKPRYTQFGRPPGISKTFHQRLLVAHYSVRGQE